MRNQRPNQVSDDLYASPRTLTNYFNRAAFAHARPGDLRQPAPERDGRTALLECGSGDLARAGIAAAHRLELRLETFNLFNTFNWGDPADAEAAGGAIATFSSPSSGASRRRPAPRASSSSA